LLTKTNNRPIIGKLTDNRPIIGKLADNRPILIIGAPLY